MKNKRLDISDIGSLTTLIVKICERMGFGNIEYVNPFILSANHNTIMGKQTTKIVCTLSVLNGKLDDFIEQIKTEFKEHDEVVIVSSNPKIISNYFKEWTKKMLKTDKVYFWDQATLIDRVDNYLPEYWGHNDLFLKSFEDSFLKHMESNGELQKVLKLDKKFEELLNIFIEPKIFRYKEDEKSGRLIRARFRTTQYLDGNNYFISGDAGTGKSTLLKEIGKLAIKQNESNINKILPIRIKTSLIVNSNFSLGEAIGKEIAELVGAENYDKVFDDYKVLLLIDSIDEFENNNQKNIFDELNELVLNEEINFIIATRNYETLTKECEICEHIHTTLSNFDLNQVQQFLNTFFKTDLHKSEELWNSLQDNKILDRIPSTPLTISLVSILFEENGYEIPATITDVYDNFNTFLLGRLNVNSNLDFLKIDVKQKILQMYALEIIKSPNRNRYSKEDFINYVIEYFKGQSITIQEELIPELIKSMTDGTGVLYIDDQGFVTYQHDHFMEYYASREIFDDENRNKLEDEIIDRFCEYNWQNTAIFYTGRTKNMKLFLEKLTTRVKKYKLLHEHLLSISGMGYILQSLWMTHSDFRKEAVLTTLDLLILADTQVKQLAEQKFPFFNGIKDTDIAVANLAWFFLHYNSITLRDPLNLAFDELHGKINELNDTQFEKDKTTTFYKLFCIAATLNTGRLKDAEKINILFNQDKLLTNPLFVYLFDEAITILEFEQEAKIRKDYKIASKKTRYNRAIRFLLDNKSEDLRHSTFEKISPIKEVELFTEGRSDASILNHAFRVLTMNEEPYWNVTSVDDVKSSKAGGAQQLASFIKRLANDIETDFDKSKVVIGVFDNDNNIILPESWTRGLVKKSLNLTKRYDQTNPTQIHA